MNYTAWDLLEWVLRVVKSYKKLLEAETLLEEVRAKRELDEAIAALPAKLREMFEEKSDGTDA